MINLQMNVILSVKIREFLITLHILKVISITLVVMKSHSSFWEYDSCTSCIENVLSYIIGSSADCAVVVHVRKVFLRTRSTGV